ncbi:PH domain-containing protein [Metabacillus fastidiosus]|uniref:PH domain-containing protein n=1 Tax=Metabacillus fastidiosus TaxID=1458 RepID=A0ABU6P1F3_9BACI|nr:PH domain-containing protein [Metabacillus fastidiosus]MED4403189.1 PH domain-containing protein [Metabacillus fastidiosus]MED4455422.1 PH domain-containing protein [Metabacillus fastidiosus]MED4461613.1 PH domain-containing protein [Metabacillus fastidiosus]
MFKKIAADALGLSDIGTIIKPADYDKTDADDYVMHEDDEKIYFLIKTKADEYCFTNLALIHVDGESAISSKRTLKRYPYSQHKISNVMLETAGKIDMDVEIKFNLGNQNYDIDVRKDQIEELKDLYKALLRISEITHENEIIMDMAGESLNKAVTVLHNSRTNEVNISNQYKELTEFGFTWLTSVREQYHEKDFGEVFEKYINN